MPLEEGPQWVIRHLRLPAEFERCVDLQKIVWGFDHRDTVPARLMIVVQQHGGLALGAFDGEAMIAFLFAIPSLHDNRFAQHSHMLAVLQEYRDQGLGRRMKLAQYRDAVARNIPVITWTFDPLETKNAFLNLNRLGAVSNTYFVNLYGERTSSDLHSGLGTDRFLVEWLIGQPRTERILSGEDPVPPDWQRLRRVLSWSGRDRFVPGTGELDSAERQLLVEAPPDTQLLKKLDRDAACRWREATRGAFLRCFDRGYRIKALVRSLELLPVEDYRLRRTFYLLERHED
ncbi:MAG: hypothetical protein HY315_01470 [Acidobacteria bacterium]|nr:hypothetical protein [Acidobacteriota bacterium]